jgi:hypothetical protein
LSQRVSFLDFDRELQIWLDAFKIAEKDQRSTFYHRFKGELRVLRYLEVHQGKVTIQRHPMLEILASFKLAKKNADLVRIDLETVWAKFMVRNDLGMHAFSPTENGFELLFAVAPGKQYVVSGVMQITALRG